MTLTMPPPDQGTIDRRDELVAALRAIVPGEGVIDDPDALRPYEPDGAVGFASDTSDDDEACALAGIAVAGLAARA